MAVLRACLCCSLLLGSIVGGVCTAVVYLLAFVIALWWIVEAEAGLVEVKVGEEGGAPIPIPAYLLCLSYLVLLIMSLWMLLGLYKRKDRNLLVWLFVMTIFFLPEMGMVIFMSFVHWGVASSYGLADLIFYILRAAVNLMTALCVQSLYSTWRDVAAASESLKRLEHLHKGGKEDEERGEKTISYHNPAFTASPESPTRQQKLPPSALSRSASAGYLYSGYRGPDAVRTRLPGWDPYVTPARDSHSEFNAAMFNPGSVGFMPLVTGARGDEGHGVKGMSVYHHSPQVMVPQEYPFVSPLPHPFYSTQSLDRRYMRRTSSMSAGSVEALNLRAGMGYLRHAHESRSSLGAESDDFRRYRDVAL